MPYIKEYSTLNPKEKRQLSFKRRFKTDHPEWDDTLILATKRFDTVLPQDNHGLRILDFGCGNGNWIIDELRSKIKTAIGIDVDPEATAKNKSVDKIIIGTLDHPHLTPLRFDAAVSLWVLEHLQNPEKEFTGINRILKPGGVFVFVTPYKWNGLIIARRLINLISSESGNRLISRLYGRYDKDIFPTFYKANTMASITTLAAKTGFKVLSLEYNFDPSYTSFNQFSYGLTRLAYRTQLPLFMPHLIGVLQKNFGSD